MLRLLLCYHLNVVENSRLFYNCFSIFWLCDLIRLVIETYCTIGVLLRSAYRSLKITEVKSSS